MAFGQLQVVLGLGRLVPGGDFAVGPIGVLQGLADALHFLASNRPGMCSSMGRYLKQKAPMVLILIHCVKPEDE
jgi:NADH:ubiquinone oxidoreductase subunit H